MGWGPLWSRSSRVQDSPSVAQTGLPGAAGLEKHIRQALCLCSTRRQKTKPRLLAGEARGGRRECLAARQGLHPEVGSMLGPAPGAACLPRGYQGAARGRPVLVPSWLAFPSQSSPHLHLPPATLRCRGGPDVSTARRAAAGTGVLEVTCASLPGADLARLPATTSPVCLNGAQTSRCALLRDNSGPPAPWTWLRVGPQRSECIQPKP